MTSPPGGARGCPTSPSRSPRPWEATSQWNQPVVGDGGVLPVHRGETAAHGGTLPGTTRRRATVALTAGGLLVLAVLVGVSVGAVPMDPQQVAVTLLDQVPG